MIIQCNIFLLDKDVLEQEEALGIRSNTREDYDTPCPFSFDTEEVATIMASLDSDKIPKPTSIISLKNGYEYEINIPFNKAFDLVWGDAGIKVYKHENS